MKEQRLAGWTVAVLLVVGGLLVSMRIYAMRTHRMTDRDMFWRVTYDISFVPAKVGGRIRLALPDNAAHTRVFRERFSHESLWMDVVRNKKTGGREVVAVALSASGPLRFTAELDVHVTSAARWSSHLAKRPLMPAERAGHLGPEKAIQTDSPAVAEVLARLSRETTGKESLLAGIFEYCAEAIGPAKRGAEADAETVLECKSGDAVGRARAMVALCRAARIPARLVAGFILMEGSDVRPHVWVEARPGKNWLSYDPQNGYARTLPPPFLLVRRDAIGVVRVRDVRDSSTSFSVRAIAPPLEALASQRSGFLAVFDLTRMAPGMRETLAIILLLPLGALITAVFRNFVGIQTFGTFTPSLLALSFLYSDWRAGIAVFVLVIAVGLLGRSALNRLKLLMVPRLGLVLTLVVLCLAMAVSLLDRLGLTPSARAVILPMVILTMVIERFHIAAEEDGRKYAARLLLNTLLVAASCLLLLRWEMVGQLAVTFPEGQFFVAAGLVLIGRYSGYRLTELWRFRDIVQSDQKGEM